MAVKPDRRTREYWNRRVLTDKALIINDAERYLQQNQAVLYGQAEKEIQEEVDLLYSRFAKSQEVSLAEARRLIRGADFKKIDWEGMAQQSMALREQIRSQKGILPDEIISAMEEEHKKLEDRIAALSKRGQISYLELRQAEIDQKLLKLYDAQQMDIYDYLQSEYEDSYYRQVYNTQQYIGFGHDFVRPNGAAIDKAILNQYQRQNFSQTLYRHCDHFSADLRRNLVTGLIRGENLDRMAKRIHDRMGVARSAAKRLVRTETAYVYEQATLDAYGQCDIEYYEYLATLDQKTSEICRQLDGKHFKVKDAMPGKNYPPMHPNCRSTTVCWFPGEEEKKKQTQRIAKDGDGKYYEVPADMTYKKWSKKYAENQVRENARDDISDSVYLIHDVLTDLRKPVKLNQIPYAKTVRRMVEENDSPVARLLLKHYNKINIINLAPKYADAFVDWENRTGIRIDMEKAARDRRGQFQPLYHEIGHYLDKLLGYPSKDKAFRKALEKDAANVLLDYMKRYGAGADEKLKDNNRSYPALYHSLRDILDGATKGKYGGHKKSYWERNPDNLTSEAFAHFCEAELSMNAEKEEKLRESFPGAYKLFKEMVKNAGGR